MSVRMSPVTTLICGGWPPTPLGQEKPVPCMEHVHLMGSWMMWGRVGAEVTVPKEQKGWLTVRLLPAPAAGDSMRLGSWPNQLVTSLLETNPRHKSIEHR